MAPISKCASLLASVVAIAVTASCSRKEPEPPTTPPAPESQSQSGTSPPLSTNTPPAPASVTTDASSGSTDGATIYKSNCETCHGPKGAGDGPAAAALNPKPASFVTNAFKFDPNGNGTKGDVEDIQAVVRDGAARYGGSPLMVPWPNLTAEQRGAVAKYVKSLAGG